MPLVDPLRSNLPDLRRSRSHTFTTVTAASSRLLNVPSYSQRQPAILMIDTPLKYCPNSQRQQPCRPAWMRHLFPCPTSTDGGWPDAAADITQLVRKTDLSPHRGGKQTCPVRHGPSEARMGLFWTAG